MKKLQRFLSSILCLAMLASMTATYAYAVNPTSFSDVPTTHWASSYIEKCVSKGIVSGVGNNKFNPDGELSNAHFVTMVVNAFYSDLLDKSMDSPWYTPYMSAARKNDLLTGTEVSVTDVFADNSMTRRDMALVLNNALKKARITATDDQKFAARAEIKDWNNVASMYSEAVSTCYALGILSGYSDGTFGSTKTMTRAQACVVIVRLEDVFANTTPAPLPGTKTEIGVTLDGRAYSVDDNGYETGKLNNGKPITEANVLELLTEAEKIWPTGMTWAEHTTSKLDNHWYETPGVVVKKLLSGKSNSNYACGGFAAMISDYVFGKTNNPARKLDDLSKIRPGDIIIAMNGSTVKHVMIAMGHTFENSGFIGVDVAEGNANDTVMWPEEIYGNGTWLVFPASVNNSTTCVAYTRYPD